MWGGSVMTKSILAVGGRRMYLLDLAGDEADDGAAGPAS
jgi:hypothetical protein